VAGYGRISPSEIPIGYLGGILEVDILPYCASQNDGGMRQNIAKDQLLKYLLGISGAFKNMILYSAVFHCHFDCQNRTEYHLPSYPHTEPNYVTIGKGGSDW
jgi:hypothetical protein